MLEDYRAFIESRPHQARLGYAAMTFASALGVFLLIDYSAGAELAAAGWMLASTLHMGAYLVFRRREREG